MERFRVRKAGKARGKLLRPGSLRVGRGSIPELKTPTSNRSSRQSSRSSEDVDTTVGSTGDRTKFTACSGSRWVISTRTSGEGVGTYLQVHPTDDARGHVGNGQEDDPYYRELWDDVMRCAPLTASTPGSQRHSMYMQLACHARYEWTGQTGDTWDLEAWHNDLDWSDGLHPLKRCGSGYGEVSDAFVDSNLPLLGSLISAFPDPQYPPRRSWLIDSNGLRRHVPTVELYGCLTAQHGEARWFSVPFIELYFPDGGELTSSDCVTIPAPQPTLTPVPTSPTPGPSSPTPTPSAPATVRITVDNRVTNGSTQMREDTPAYLSTVTRNYCKRDGCALGGTDVGSGATLSAACTLLGDRTTNGQDNSSIDDNNPGLYSSTRWYGIRWGDGRFGYVSEVWIAGGDRGGKGLRAC